MQFRFENKKIKLNKITSGLYLVSTPIGNLSDITLRALSILKSSDFILCEDTRRSGKLLSYYNIVGKLMPYHKFNEKSISNKIIDLLMRKKVISLISDAGTPLISDPGLFLIKECIKKKINIYPIPGPSAVTTSISVSGFEDKYFFYGFLPKKKNELYKILKKISNFDYSIVFFIPARKINFYLNQFRIFFNNRSIMIAKEMTKVYESFLREQISKIKDFKGNLKGEFTVVISPKIKEKNSIIKIDESVKLEIKKMLKLYSHRDVVHFISKKENLPKKIVYELCLKLKK
jgi:16S rRNA (cytidine1402-2'-O)-methyltransferase